MKRAKTIWAWLTLLLFIGSIASPRLFAAPLAPCPMLRGQAAPAKPACCRAREASLAPRAALPHRCCCDMTAAKERTDVPALLPDAPVLALLPDAPAPLAAPSFAPVLAVSVCGDRQTAPRAPPRRTSPPRAPPS